MTALSRGFPLGAGDAQQIDLIAVEKELPNRCFVYTAASADAAIEVSLQGAYTFHLAAFAGNQMFDQDYRVDVDKHRLTVTMIRASQQEK